MDVGPNGEGEFFLVTEGELTIEFEDAKRVTLRVNDSVVIPAGVVHRTRPAGRTVNLLVEPKNVGRCPKNAVLRADPTPQVVEPKPFARRPK